MAILGVDVSEYQGEMDWPKCKALGRSTLISGSAPLTLRVLTRWMINSSAIVSSPRGPPHRQVLGL